MTKQRKHLEVASKAKPAFGTSCMNYMDSEKSFLGRLGYMKCVAGKKRPI